MSVQIARLKGGRDFCDVDVMAADYDCARIWLEYDDARDRIDISREQLAELRRVIDRILAK